MKLNTLVRFESLRGPDGENVATVCWHNLDGHGAVWGEHTFEMPYGGFGDELPEPDVMLSDVEYEVVTDGLEQVADALGGIAESLREIEAA